MYHRKNDYLLTCEHDRDKPSVNDVCWTFISDLSPNFLGVDVAYRLFPFDFDS